MNVQRVSRRGGKQQPFPVVFDKSRLRIGEEYFSAVDQYKHCQAGGAHQMALTRVPTTSTPNCKNSKKIAFPTVNE